MTTVEACAKEAAENSRELLGLLTATRGTAAFFRKHGPRVISFGTGLLAAAGIGNPAVWAFLGNFFS